MYGRNTRSCTPVSFHSAWEKRPKPSDSDWRPVLISGTYGSLDDDDEFKFVNPYLKSKNSFQQYTYKSRFTSIVYLEVNIALLQVLINTSSKYSH